ncbi:MAG: ubiquitin-like protein UBact [Armatimonadetes bacterium]|nr:ubiquitin-like protein UBact [Armatimonadota bacterium]
MIIRSDDRLRREVVPQPGPKHGDDSGPSKPDVRKPGGENELLKRMKRVDPDRAKKYRQRSGQ